jgi:aminoglycoside phosphotransferase family enzyme
MPRATSCKGQPGANIRKAVNVAQHDSPSIEEKAAFLGSPQAYPNGVRFVESKQTHMSWVFLTETHAWKLKKPVRYDYLDFSSVEARRKNCEQELMLNRRLAASVYLRVVPLTLVEGQLRIGGEVAVVDWLVQMRRLPADRMLDWMIAAHTWSDDDLQRVGRLLASFYRTSLPLETSGESYRKRLFDEFHSCCIELERAEYRLPPELVKPIVADGSDFIQQRLDLLDERVERGKIVDGHGDLRAEHICLEPQPVIIDCLEFNASLRVLDCVSELAFLKLECERLGAPEVGERILDVYRLETGDTPRQEILEFYRIFHAAVRAKLALWHLRDAPDNSRKWIERARTYLRLATPQA